MEDPTPSAPNVETRRGRWPQQAEVLYVGRLRPTRTEKALKHETLSLPSVRAVCVRQSFLVAWPSASKHGQPLVIVVIGDGRLVDLLVL
jgi:hypothetical protein